MLTGRFHSLNSITLMLNNKAKIVGISGINAAFSRTNEHHESIYQLRLLGR